MIPSTRLSPAASDRVHASLAGEPDVGYGVLGRTCAEYPHFGSVGSESIAYASALDAQGRIIVAGHSFDAQGTLVASVVRFHANGTPDAEFGVRGFVTLPTQLPSGAAWLRCVVAQDDGSLILGFDVKGTHRRHVLLRRLRSCGAPDLEYLQDGGGAVEFAPTSTLDMLHGLRALPGGALLVLATTHLDRFHGAELALLRLQPNGTPDAAFGMRGGPAGIAWVPRPSGTYRRRSWLLALAPEGRVVVAGDLLCAQESAPAGVAACLLDACGRPVQEFGCEGLVRLEHTRNDALRDLACRPDGRIVAVLQSVDLGASSFPKVMQLLPHGELDRAFARSGVLITPLGGDATCQRPQACALQPDGKLLLAGTPWAEPGGQRVTITRLLSNGARDTEFGVGGSLHCGFSHTAGSVGGVCVDSVSGLHLTRDRILVAGHMLECEMKYKYCALALYM